MGFDTALGTTHGQGSVSHTQSFPGTQQKSLLLTQRQRPDRFFQGSV
jgi:hypothetical protein